MSTCANIKTKRARKFLDSSVVPQLLQKLHQLYTMSEQPKPKPEPQSEEQPEQNLSSSAQKQQPLHHQQLARGQQEPDAQKLEQNEEMATPIASEQQISEPPRIQDYVSRTVRFIQIAIKSGVGRVKITRITVTSSP